MADNYNIIRQQYHEMITIMSDKVNNGNKNNILQDNLHCGVFHKDHKRCKLASHSWPVWGEMPLGAGGVKDNINGKDGELDDNAEKYFNQFEHSYI